MKKLVMSLLLGILWGGGIFFPENISGKVIDELDFPVLSLSVPNDTGEAIWWAQAQLYALGHRMEPADGIFDEEMQQEIMNFQDSVGLEPDGVLEKEDWQELVFGNIFVVNSLQDHPMWIEIDIAQHVLILYQNKQEIKRYEVGIGKSSTPSPLGESKIISKQTNWGNGFGTRWMGLNVPWGEK